MLLVPVIVISHYFISVIISEELIVIRRMTYQLPIGALHACKALNVDENSSILVIEGKSRKKCVFDDFVVADKGPCFFYIRIKS
jgi:hypothetical protein